MDANTLKTHMEEIRKMTMAIARSVESGKFREAILGLKKVDYYTWEIQLPAEPGSAQPTTAVLEVPGIGGQEGKPKRQRATKAEMDARRAATEGEGAPASAAA